MFLQLLFTDHIWYIQLYVSATAVWGKKGDYLKLQATLECKLNVTLLYKFSPVGSVTIPMQLLLLQQLPFIVEYPILMPTYNTHSSLFLDGKEVGRKESSADLIFAYRF